MGVGTTKLHEIYHDFILNNSIEVIPLQTPSTNTQNGTFSHLDILNNMSKDELFNVIIPGLSNTTTTTDGDKVVKFMKLILPYKKYAKHHFTIDELLQLYQVLRLHQIEQEKQYREFVMYTLTDKITKTDQAKTNEIMYQFVKYGYYDLYVWDHCLQLFTNYQDASKAEGSIQHRLDAYDTMYLWGQYLKHAKGWYTDPRQAQNVLTNR